MKKNIKQQLSKSKSQLIIILTVQVVILTAGFIVYKQIVLDGGWSNFSYSNTNFVYTQYETIRKFQAAYWQIDTAIGFINNIFTSCDTCYASISMCTIDTCFEQQSQNPDLDVQYKQIGAYQGTISNITNNSTFGNLGLLIWQFKYSRANNIESFEIILQSSNASKNMKLHIPVQEYPIPHVYVLNGAQNISFNPSDIVVSKSFSFSKDNETLSGIVSTRINIQKLKDLLNQYKLRMQQKHTGNVYIDTLDTHAPYSSKQVSLSVGSMTADLVLMQQTVILNVVYVNAIYIICTLLLLSLIPIIQRINNFYKKYINPVNSMNNILKQKLNQSFNNCQIKKHNLIGVNQQLNELCERCQQLPSYNIKKQQLHKQDPYKGQFKFISKLNEISEKFKSRIKQVDQSCIYNNKFIIKINSDFEQQKSVLKSLMEIVNPVFFYKIAYMTVCEENQSMYLKLVNECLCKYSLRKEQKIILIYFYHRFHARSLQELRSKINGENQIESDISLAESLNYFDGLHLSAKQLNEKTNLFKIYYEKAFFERVRNIVLSKYLVFIKDSDKDLYYLKLFQFEHKIIQIEQEVDNLRYQMSRKTFKSQKDQHNLDFLS